MEIQNIIHTMNNKGRGTEKGNWKTNSFNFDFIRIKAA